MNSSKVRRLASAALLVLLAACGSDDLSTADFNAHYQVGKREKYLGVARGLDQCGALAYSQANLDNAELTGRRRMDARPARCMMNQGAARAW